VHGVWRTATFQHSYGQCWVTLALPLRGHLAYQILDPERTSRDAHRMPQSKRPALRKQDRVTLSRIKSPIPAYAGKPFVGREDVLTVSHITGTGAKRNPWGVVVTDGTHFWHLEPGDVTPAETPISVCTGCRQPAHASETDDAGYHPGCVPTERGGQKHSTKKHLDNWLNSHGYRHAHARKQKTPHRVTAHGSRNTEEIQSRCLRGQRATRKCLASTRDQKHSTSAVQHTQMLRVRLRRGRRSQRPPPGRRHDRSRLFQTRRSDNLGVSGLLHLRREH